MLLDVQKYFHISDSHAGLLQTGKEPVLDPGARAFCQPASGGVLWLAPAPESFGTRELGVEQALELESAAGCS